MSDKRYLPLRVELPNVKELREVAALMIESGCFKDTASIAQACIKIIAGAEYGFTPFVSMRGIHMIQGQPCLSANLIAASVKRYAGGTKYKWKVVERSAKRAAIEVFEDGESQGVCEWTMAQAEQAKLTLPTRTGEPSNFVKYPEDMLWARVQGRTARTFHQDVFGGPVYTPEDFDVVVGEDGNVIAGEVDAEPPKAQGKRMKPTSAPSVAQSTTTASSGVAAASPSDTSSPQDVEIVGKPSGATAAPSTQSGSSAATAEPPPKSDSSQKLDVGAQPVSDTSQPTTSASLTADEMQANIKAACVNAGYDPGQSSHILKVLFGVTKKSELAAKYDDALTFLQDPDNANGYGAGVKVEFRMGADGSPECFEVK